MIALQETQFNFYFDKKGNRRFTSRVKGSSNTISNKSRYTLSCTLQMRKISIIVKCNPKAYSELHPSHKPLYCIQITQTRFCFSTHKLKYQILSKVDKKHQRHKHLSTQATGHMKLNGNICDKDIA